ncbi:MAG: glycosyltransferase family 4 protein [Thermodesulfovibrionales bacterium]
MRDTDVLFYASLQPNKRGSFEDFICHLASACKENNIKIKFVVGNDVSNQVKILFKEYHVEWYPLPSKASVKAFARVIKETKPKLVHFHFISPCSFLIVVCRLLNVPKVILTDHCSTSMDHNDSKFRSFFLPLICLRRNLLNKLVDHYIAVSGFVADRLILEDRINRDKISTIYNGIDLERFFPTNEKSKFKKELFKIEDSRIVISYIGQLIPEKGISVFLDAARLLIEKRSSILFVIAGEGPLMQLIRNKIQESGNASHFLFLGQRNDIDAILKASDILVCPSIWEEAFGLIIAEAMASGVPVVATRVGGIPEVVSDGETGILVEPNNSFALAQAIETLLEDNEMRNRFGIAGCKKASDYFSIDNIVLKTMRVYQENL